MRRKIEIRKSGRWWGYCDYEILKKKHKYDKTPAWKIPGYEIGDLSTHFKLVLKPYPQD